MPDSKGQIRSGGGGKDRKQEGNTYTHTLKETHTHTHRHTETQTQILHPYIQPYKLNPLHILRISTPLKHTSPQLHTPQAVTLPTSFIPWEKRHEKPKSPVDSRRDLSRVLIYDRLVRG